MVGLSFTHIVVSFPCFFFSLAFFFFFFFLSASYCMCGSPLFSKFSHIPIVWGFFFQYSNVTKFLEAKTNIFQSYHLNFLCIFFFFFFFFFQNCTLFLFDKYTSHFSFVQQMEWFSWIFIAGHNVFAVLHPVQDFVLDACPPFVCEKIYSLMYVCWRHCRCLLWSRSLPHVAFQTFVSVNDTVCVHGEGQ